MTPETAKTLFGRRFLGPDQLALLGKTLPVPRTDAPPLPWADDILEANAATHMLLYCPTSFADGRPITLNTLRSHFGIEPGLSEPCFYNQDWYVKENFANASLAGGWRLIRVAVLENARARTPEDIQTVLSRTEAFPTAVTCAFAFFANWIHTNGELLWAQDYIWCRDKDHQGDRVYVGRYKDPAGINKNGFSIHRHLSLRTNYSAAPEIVSI
jgi:hypothetical protein